jgi:hypothetical protein
MGVRHREIRSRCRAGSHHTSTDGDARGQCVAVLPGMALGCPLRKSGIGIWLDVSRCRTVYVVFSEDADEPGWRNAVMLMCKPALIRSITTPTRPHGDITVAVAARTPALHATDLGGRWVEG